MWPAKLDPFKRAWTVTMVELLLVNMQMHDITSLSKMLLWRYNKKCLNGSGKPAFIDRGEPSY